MPKQKSGAQIQVADGAGGMRPLVDLRVEAGDWPIALVIPSKNAESWMLHLAAEIKDAHGWNPSGLSQLEPAENSGTITVHAAPGPVAPAFEIIWQRLRGADLEVKVRPAGNAAFPLDEVRKIIDAVNERARKRVTDKQHRWDMLTYEGLPWRGELWLGDDIRLGPPSQFPADALIGPQVVIVDAMVEGIGNDGIRANFTKCIRELQIFLGVVVLGVDAKPVRPQRDWVTKFDEQLRPIACTLGTDGYWEIGPEPRVFPSKAACKPVPRETVVRPGLGRTGIWPDMTEQWVPEDIEDLWRALLKFPAAKRDHFLRAGNAFMVARSMWPDQKTACAAFLVVACEALKPSGRRYENMNVYDVIASLVGTGEAEQFRQLSVHPQKVRSGHLHRGELVGGELAPMLLGDYFADPSFLEMLTKLWSTCRICLIEWLRCAGEYKVVRLPRPNRTSWLERILRKCWSAMVHISRDVRSLAQRLVL